MTKYLIGRILRALVSVVIVVAVIMVMVYSFLDKRSIFANDSTYTKTNLNNREVYMMQQWEQFGYLDYIPFADYLTEEMKAGTIDKATYDAAIILGKDADKDSDTTAKYVKLFQESTRKAASLNCTLTRMFLS